MPVDKKGKFHLHPGAAKMHDSIAKPVESQAEENAEEEIHPGIHEEVSKVVAEHGPAHTINITHDHEAKTSHVHSVHGDGYEHHSDHQGEQHHAEAHAHASEAAGLGGSQPEPALEDESSEAEDEY